MRSSEDQSDELRRRVYGISINIADANFAAIFNVINTLFARCSRHSRPTSRQLRAHERARYNFPKGEGAKRVVKEEMFLRLKAPVIGGIPSISNKRAFSPLFSAAVSSSAWLATLGQVCPHHF